MERGEFDHLPGQGQPMPDIDRPGGRAVVGAEKLKSGERVSSCHRRCSAQGP